MSMKREIAISGGLICLVMVAIIFLTAFGFFSTKLEKELQIAGNKGITDLVVTYDNDGHQTDIAKSEDRDYKGFIISLYADAPQYNYTEREVASCYADIEKLGSDGLFYAEDIDAIEEFTDKEYISYIEPNYEVKMLDTFEMDANTVDPDDPYYTSGKQWNLTMMNVQESWDDDQYGQKYDSSSDDDRVSVAVIDSGLYGTGGTQANSSHEDINYERVVEGVNQYDSTSGTPDYMGHGTFVSGMIFAKMNNGLGIAGISPEVDIIPIRVFGSANSTYTETIIKGIYSSIDKDADVINLSLGSTSYNASFKTACDDAVENGALVVAAAGNDGNGVNHYPAAYDSVVGVSSLDEDGNHSYFSQYGKSVFVAAPGAYVNSLGVSNATSYSNGSGTSFSSPEVAALAAMVKALEPEMDQAGFMELLKKTSVDKGSEGYDDYYGWGLVNFGATTKSLLADKDRPAYYVSFDVKDENSDFVNGYGITVKAAEDIVWDDYPSEGIKAGSISKGTVIDPDEDGVYVLHKGSYEYTVNADGHYKGIGIFSTYSQYQTVSVSLEKSYDTEFNILDSENDMVDEATLKIIRINRDAEESVIQNNYGKYNVALPSGTYSYIATADGYDKAKGKFAVGDSSSTQEITLLTEGEICTLNFAFMDSTSGEKIDGFDIRVMDSKSKELLPGEDGKYHLMKGQKYSYIATRVGYEDAAGKVFTGNNSFKTVEVCSEVVQHTILIDAVDSNDNAISDPVVTLKDSDSKVISSSKSNSGKYNLANGTYSYVVSKTGYADIKATIEVKNNSRNIKVVLPSVRHHVTFQVTGKNLPVVEYNISVYDSYGNLHKNTQDNSYKLPSGSYRYYVYSEGYEIAKGSFAVAGVDKSVVVAMDTKIENANDTSDSEFESGSGTSSDPYIIVSEDQLRALSEKTSITYANSATASTNKKVSVTGHYILMCDINVRSKPWTPIGNYESSSNYALFEGKFCGGGYEISDVGVSSIGSDNGFFGGIKGASVKNLSVSGHSKGTEYTGGLIGRIFYNSDNGTTVENCINKMSVTGTTNVGGIVGGISGSSGERINNQIISCANVGKIKAVTGSSYSSVNTQAGGIAGSAYATKITSCYNQATVDGGLILGGIAGQLHANTYAYGCYNIGAVTYRANVNDGQVGNIVGILSGTVKGAYYLSGVSSNNSVAGIYNSGGSAKETARYTNAANMQTQDFVDLLNMREDVNYGDYQVSDSFPILEWQGDVRDVFYAQQPEIILQPQGNVGIPYNVNESAKPIVAKVGTVTDDGDLTYRWYENDFSTNALADAIDGASGSVPEDGVISFTPDTSEIGIKYYFVIITNTSVSSNGDEATNRCQSEFAQIIVANYSAAQAPVIDRVGFESGADKDKTANRDSWNTISVQAHSEDGGIISYQWYKSKYSDTKGTPISGGTGNSYNFSIFDSGTYYYYVKVTNTVYDAQKNIYSNNSIKSDRLTLVVTNYTDADENAANLAVSKINAIGTVTLQSKSKIDEARGIYNGLTTIQKSLVDSITYKVLINAEVRYNELKKDNDTADTVISKIKAIGTVALNSKLKINDARAAYNALTSSQKTLIPASVYKILTDCESKYKKLKANDDAKKSFVKKQSKITKAKAGKKKVTLTWKKIGAATGYQIYYGKNKKITKGKKIITIKSTKNKKVIKKLKSKRKYYVKVRGYKVVGGKKVYSKWSSTKKIKIK